MNRRPNFTPRKKKPLPIFPLHPVSVAQVNKGHPWVTLDRFSKSFPAGESLVAGTDKRGKMVGIFLHDPSHPQVVARLWSREEDFRKVKENFYRELYERIDLATRYRAELKIHTQRDNFYLVFAEADRLPGLRIQLMGNVAIVQTYMQTWRKWEKKISQGLLRSLGRHFPELKIAQIRFQMRNKKGELKENVFSVNSKLPFSETVQEFGIKYQTLLKERYDIGLYSDAASLREKLIPYFEKAQRVLNLYSYTGAFSLCALKYGRDIQVHSVDLSERNMKALEKNINLNDSSWHQRHHSHLLSTHEALSNFNKQGEDFDLIINDPPPSSFDGKKKKNALESYQKDLPILLNLLAPEGILVAMLNTQSVTRKKFVQLVKEHIASFDSEGAFEIVANLGLDQDCPTQAVFPEGDYLKIVLIKRMW